MTNKQTKKLLITCKINVALFLLLFSQCTLAQIIINEGSNKNFQSITDNDGDNPDWIELYNSGNNNVELGDFFLTDDSQNTTQWPLPGFTLAPDSFLTIFCSNKNRYPLPPYTNVLNSGIYTPTNAWNTHVFTTAYNWDGISNIIINMCSYSSAGYTSNSVVKLTNTSYRSTIAAVNDGNDASCSASSGTPFYSRPLIKLNNINIGTPDTENSPTDYPAPYGNWYWCARHQFLIPASELIAAGLSTGPISSIAFQVVASDNAVYDDISFSMGPTQLSEFSNTFQSSEGNIEWHTNFKIDAQGELVYLYHNSQPVSSLLVNAPAIDYSVGCQPDGSTTIKTFLTPSPQESNNANISYTQFTPDPFISVLSGFYTQPKLVHFTCSDTTANIYYTTNGNEPDTSDNLYNGSPVYIVTSSAVRARAFAPDKFPSNISSSTILINVNHSTPVLSVMVDNNHLYGPEGIFDNIFQDWNKPAEAVFFDSTKQFIFKSPAAMRMDGGAGGSRTHPQRSFRLNFSDAVMGFTPINYPFIPDRPQRNIYSKIYLRNGSNQFNVLPYKDACQVQAMCKDVNAYYSAYRPVSVYINGGYFGLYELREKLDDEFFIQSEQANPENMHLLSLSYYYGSILRAQMGSVDTFYQDYNNWLQINAADSSYWNLADQYFDLKYYTDYIIGETWMANVDWPGNNIKIYKSDKTDFRWRFATIDLELAMAPNSWTDCYSDNVEYILGQSTDNPYINVFLKSLQNQRFRNYFINRFADVMNYYYTNQILEQREQNIYNWVVPEMPNQFFRWADPNDVTSDMNNFNQNHLVFRDQLLLRTNIVQDHLVNNFQLQNKIPVTLNVIPPGGGNINISTITPQQYPWSGTYFNRVPIGIKAIPAPGFEFSHWEPNVVLNDTLSNSFTDTLNTTSPISFTAHFKSVYTNLPQYSDRNLLVYPVPANNQIYVLVKKNEASSLNYTISDCTGRQILTGTLYDNKTHLISTSEIASGTYLLSIWKANQSVNHYPIIIMH